MPTVDRDLRKKRWSYGPVNQWGRVEDQKITYANSNVLSCLPGDFNCKRTVPRLFVKTKKSHRFGGRGERSKDQRKVTNSQRFKIGLLSGLASIRQPQLRHFARPRLITLSNLGSNAVCGHHPTLAEQDPTIWSVPNDPRDHYYPRSSSRSRPTHHQPHHKITPPTTSFSRLFTPLAP